MRYWRGGCPFSTPSPGAHELTTVFEENNELALSCMQGVTCQGPNSFTAKGKAGLDAPGVAQALRLTAG
eukprot:scaffold215964_cov14-Tisochrysis_lutea.AAC.1